ncbi:MAG: WD40/YVTN/BNR-like repeat-containing protein, partial [Nitrososphaeraceae archaeon]
RWIEPDANNPDYVFAAIEAGALVQSRDGGKTWMDRNEQGPYDTHTLATHSKAPKRLYSSAGDGYFESFDYGETWARPMEGLRHGYLFGIAVDSSNPEVVIISASNGPSRSYAAENAETFVYRRDANGKGWEIVKEGLPRPRESTIMSFTPNVKTPGEFYAVNNHGLFLSTNSGSSWKKLDTIWSKEYLQQTPWAIAINER